MVSGIELVEDEVEQDGAAETASAWPATAATAAPPARRLLLSIFFKFSKIKSLFMGLFVTCTYLITTVI